jgi:KaiC/GvpD/RAD55 family RecA-like ATPase
MGLKTSIDQEKLIFAYTLKRPQYLPAVGGDFFSNPDIQYLANNARLFFQEYKESPSCAQMKSIIKGDKKEIAPEIVDSIYDVDIVSYDDEWLSKTTEGWIKFRSLNHNLFDAVTLVKTTDITLDNVNDVVEKAATIVGDTNLITFDRDLGDDFFDVESHRNIKEDKIPSSWEYWNKCSHGGLDHKTLTCYIGGTNVGKSIVLCNDAANYVRMGKNVLFITCEMAKEKVTRRISANLFDMTLEEYDKLVEDPQKVKKKLKQFVSNNFLEVGKLRIKELPTGQGTVLDVERYIKEVEDTYKYKVDVVLIDYINIMCNYRLPNTENTYLKIKTLAEDLRGLAVKYDVLMITASQIGRSALDSSDINLTDVSESMGLLHTCDNVIGIIQTEEMRIGEKIIDRQETQPYYWFKILKIREGEGKGHKFRVDIVYTKMKLIERLDCIDTNDHLM